MISELIHDESINKTVEAVQAAHANEAQYLEALAQFALALGGKHNGFGIISGESVVEPDVVTGRNMCAILSAMHAEAVIRRYPGLEIDFCFGVVQTTLPEQDPREYPHCWIEINKCYGLDSSAKQFDKKRSVIHSFSTRYRELEGYNLKYRPKAYQSSEYPGIGYLPMMLFRGSTLDIDQAYLKLLAVVVS